MERARRPASIAEPVSGGVRLLRAEAFCAPGSCPMDRSRQGATRRNAFRGPGLYNLDVSLSRTLLVPRMREGTVITLRVDSFNLLNHANLSQPSADLTDAESFGVAKFGRPLRDIGVPSLLPLRETSRQIQVMLRLEF